MGEANTQYLTGIRAVAALLVFIAHSGGLGLRSLGTLGNDLADNSKFGVAMFFVVSAYCLCIVTAEAWDGRAVNWKAFYIRRAFRILPAYFVALAVYVGLHLWRGTAPDDLPLSILSHVTFANIFDAKHAHDIFIEWTVVVEVAFYILFPMFLLATRSLQRGIFLLALFLSWRSARLYFIGVIGGDFADNAYFTLPFHIYAFVFGLAAYVATKRLRLPRWVMEVVSLSSLAYLAWAMTQPDNTTNEVPITYATTGLIIGCASAETFLARALRWKPLVWIGSISFSIYLFHMAVLMLFPPSVLSGIAYQWLALGITLCVSMLGFRMIENPARQFGRKVAALLPIRVSIPSAR